jgi:3-carboxy-cis,cis-muconate cycloisomerase
VFSGVFARGDAAAQVAGAAWLQAMLDVEAALARASAREGLIPAEAAEAIAEACVAERFDAAAIGRDAASGGNPAIPLVTALRAAVGGDAAQHVHRGATSQDVVDSAAMLVARRALRPLLTDARAAADAAAALAEAHAATPMIGRTLLQQALPISFGLKAAGWMTAVDEARRALAETAERGAAVQLGGPVGALGGFGGRGPAVAAAMAEELGLAATPLPWHGDRVRPAALGAALALLAGALGKVGVDVALLAQNEVGEVREGGEGRGGSSSMGHKRNPVAAVALVACARRTPGLAATLLASMGGEHERAAGAWHAEWETLGDLLRLTGAAAAWARELLEGLEVDPARMQANLEAAAAASGADPGDTGDAASLVERALTAHRSLAS